MTLLTSRPTLETWIPASWEAFVKIADHPDSAKLKSYYFNGRMRIEPMSTVEALRRSRQSNQSVVGAWLMTEFR